MSVSDHSAFITLFTIILLVIMIITGVNLNVKASTTGYVIKSNDCSPLFCSMINLESAGNYYCDSNKCYRDCFSGSYLIEMATFCIKP